MKRIFLSVLFFSFNSLFALTLLPSFPFTTLSSPNSNSNSIPQVAVNPISDALAVWNISASNQIGAANLDHRTVGIWMMSGVIGQGGAPAVGIDNGGNGIAVWVNQGQIQTSRFVFATKVWTPIVIPSQIGFSITPKVAVNGSGFAIAVWLNTSSNGVASIVTAAVFDPTVNAWSAPVAVSIRGGATPSIGIDQNGNGIVVWQDLNTAQILTSFLFRQ